MGASFNELDYIIVKIHCMLSICTYKDTMNNSHTEKGRNMIISLEDWSWMEFDLEAQRLKIWDVTKLLWNPGGRRDLISRETSYLFGTVRLKLPTSIMIIQYMIQLPFVMKRFCLLPPKSLWGNLRKVSRCCILLISFVLFSANKHLFMHISS